MDDAALTTTVCELLASATGWAWRREGPAYGSDEVGVFYGPLDPDPDRAVGVTIYTGDDDFRTGLAVRRVQVRHRGAPGEPDGADRLADQTFRALHGLARTSGISLATRVLVAHLGADGNDRQERTDSYQIILDNPEAST